MSHLSSNKQSQTDGTDMFSVSIGSIVTVYAALHSRRAKFSPVILFYTRLLMRGPDNFRVQVHVLQFAVEPLASNGQGKSGRIWLLGKAADAARRSS